MTTSEFARIIERAVRGDVYAIEAVIKKYMPLIENNSYSNGVLDEDCRQAIMIRVMLDIPKFRL